MPCVLPTRKLETVTSPTVLKKSWLLAGGGGGAAGDRAAAKKCQNPAAAGSERQDLRRCGKDRDGGAAGEGYAVDSCTDGRRRAGCRPVERRPAGKWGRGQFRHGIQ